MRIVLIVLALLWLALRVPQLRTHYSFDWDSANYARGVAEFDVAKHQPHPPGYPLWVMGARVLAPIAGGAMRAQIVQAFLLSLAALAIFYLLATQLIPRTAFTATVLLAFSPAVSLYSAEPGTPIVDLLSSCVAGYLVFLDGASRRWRIVACMAALGVLAGFRQSGVVLLLPLIGAAILVHWRTARREVLTGIGVGLVAWLAWQIPLAISAGGWGALSRLSSEQLRISAATTSIFYGASSERHMKMIAENGIYLGMNLLAWLVAFGVWKKWSGNWRYAVWLIPNAVMLFGIHGARAGYWLLSFPPLLLLMASGAKPGPKRTIFAVIIALAISYFPYARLMSSDQATPYYLVYRSTPRLELDLDKSLNNLGRTLHELRDSGEREPYVCDRRFHEAPNFRTVSYDFPFVRWAEPIDAPPRASIWLFDQHGPTTEARQQYSVWEQIVSDDLYSIWRSTP